MKTRNYQSKKVLTTNQAAKPIDSELLQVIHDQNRAEKDKIVAATALLERGANPNAVHVQSYTSYTQHHDDSYNEDYQETHHHSLRFTLLNGYSYVDEVVYYASCGSSTGKRVESPCLSDAIIKLLLSWGAQPMAYDFSKPVAKGSILFRAQEITLTYSLDPSIAGDVLAASAETQEFLFSGAFLKLNEFLPTALSGIVINYLVCGHADKVGVAIQLSQHKERFLEELEKYSTRFFTSHQQRAKNLLTVAADVKTEAELKQVLETQMSLFAESSKKTKDKQDKSKPKYLQSLNNRKKDEYYTICRAHLYAIKPPVSSQREQKSTLSSTMGADKQLKK